MVKVLKTIVRIVYRLALIVRYPPIKGIRKVRVANSNQILFYTSVIKVPIQKMRVGMPVVSQIGERPNKLSPVKETPHYKFAKSRLRGVPGKNREAYEMFAKWLSWSKKQNNKDVALTFSDYIKNFESLIDRISKTGYFPNKSPIIVYPRMWKNDYIILDGAHRASILAAMGIKEIECGVCLWKKTENTTEIFKL